MMMDDMTLSNS